MRCSINSLRERLADALFLCACPWFAHAKHTVTVGSNPCRLWPHIGQMTVCFRRVARRQSVQIQLLACARQAKIGFTSPHTRQTCSTVEGVSVILLVPL